jgi:hypothetical protein
MSKHSATIRAARSAMAWRAYKHHLRLSHSEELLIDRRNQFPLGATGSSCYDVKHLTRT